MRTMEIDMQRLSVAEQLLIAALAGIASITSLLVLIVAPVALAA
jgi:hypothetical protein